MLVLGTAPVPDTVSIPFPSCKMQVVAWPGEESLPTKGGCYKTNIPDRQWTLHYSPTVVGWAQVYSTGTINYKTKTWHGCDLMSFWKRGRGEEGGRKLWMNWHRIHIHRWNKAIKGEPLRCWQDWIGMKAANDKHTIGIQDILVDFRNKLVQIEIWRFLLCRSLQLCRV